MEQIEKQPPIKLRFSDNEIIKGKLIGKTKDVIFLLSNKNRKSTSMRLSLILLFLIQRTLKVISW